MTTSRGNVSEMMKKYSVGLALFTMALATSGTAALAADAVPIPNDEILSLIHI